VTLRNHIKENLKLAIPVMLSNLGHVAMGVTDNVMVGNVNAVSLAAAGLAFVVFNVFLLFGIGVSYAITPLVASADGAHDGKGVIESVRHGFVINLVNSFILIAVVMVGQNLLYHINQPEEVVTLSIPFLSVIMWSLIPVMIFQTFKQFTEGLSNTRIALFVMIGANVVNIFLNYALIYGHFGLPAMGLQGSAWATFISRVFMALAIVGIVYYHKQFIRYRQIFELGRYSSSLFRNMLNLGIPSGVQFIFEVAAFDFSLVMMGWLGTHVQAAHQIAINMATVTYMTTAGLASAATIRVGYFAGSHDVKNLRTSAYSLLSMALVLMFVFAVVFITARHYLPSLYVEEQNVIDVASGLMIIAGLFQLADGTQVVCASALRGLQDVKVPSLFILVSYWVVGLPLGYIFTFSLGLGPAGVWWGLCIGLTLTAIAMFLRLKQKIQKLSLSVEKYAIEKVA
jgi:multidrug resistance protein, MATE family